MNTKLQYTNVVDKIWNIIELLTWVLAYFCVSIKIVQLTQLRSTY